MRMLVVLLPCALFSPGAMAEQFFETERAPTMFYYSDCAELEGVAWHYCIAAELQRMVPCKGSVEERLNCLEAKIAQRDEELRRLRLEFEHARRPRIQQLDRQLSLE
jgi:hypothetical protein